MLDRHEVIYAEMQHRIYRDVNRTFGWLFVVQWVSAIAIAVIRTPWTWAGAHRGIHPHVYLATGLGSLLCVCPVVMIRLYPNQALTRHIVALVQMLWSALLIMLMGGRIETHFHIFGSLAFLASYRDWKVIATATLTVAADHLIRGLAWPDGVYGVANPEWWRFLEHAAWIVFEDVVLIMGCTRGLRELREAAIREATLEQTATTIQHKVENRTRQLRDNAARYQSLLENTDAIPFEYDVAEGRVLYVGPQAARMFDCTVAEIETQGVLMSMAHPSDIPRARAEVAAFLRDERASGEPIDYRMITKLHRTVHVRTFLSGRSGTRVSGIILDVTRQTLLESELRQAQKLESVGRLAAGIAHEINTPIQFVSDSLQFTSEAVTDLLGVVSAQQAVLDAARAGPWSAELADQATRTIEDADLPYLIEHLPRALDRALDGTHRVAAIVASMKVFAHDQRTISEVDLRESIESTLTIARNEYKYVADLELKLEPVSRVMCFAGEINQVILNIIVNAAHAIGEVVAGTAQRGKITVALRQVGDDAVISISDTGGGIPEHAREHIFELFYTTKPVGKGTGQGLALARSVIVDKHHGSLTFQTELGVGTTFHIQIPIARPSDAAMSSAA